MSAIVITLCLLTVNILVYFPQPTGPDLKQALVEMLLGWSKTFYMIFV
jgi:hypothetical protein